MRFRKGQITDLAEICQIIEEAQTALCRAGVDQWQDHYPNAEVIASDLERGYGCVLEQDGQVVATLAVTFGQEKNYCIIEDGAWTTGEPYAVLHRVAVRDNCKGKGIAGRLLDETAALCRARGAVALRTDTHPDNLPMQRLLQKNNFRRCGVVYLEEGGKRLAYEKPLADDPRTSMSKQPGEALPTILLSQKTGERR